MVTSDLFCNFCQLKFGNEESLLSHDCEGLDYQEASDYEILSDSELISDNDINRFRSRPFLQPGAKNRPVSHGQRSRSIKRIAHRRKLAGRAPLSGRLALPNRRLPARRRAVAKTPDVVRRPLLTGRLIHFQYT